jgi:hypothetical protein
VPEGVPLFLVTIIADKSVGFFTEVLSNQNSFYIAFKYKQEMTFFRNNNANNNPKKFRGGALLQ